MAARVARAARAAPAVAAWVAPAVQAVAVRVGPRTAEAGRAGQTEWVYWGEPWAEKMTKMTLLDWWGMSQVTRRGQGLNEHVRDGCTRKEAGSIQSTHEVDTRSIPVKKLHLEQQAARSCPMCESSARVGALPAISRVTMGYKAKVRQCGGSVVGPL